MIAEEREGERERAYRSLRAEGLPRLATGNRDDQLKSCEQKRDHLRSGGVARLDGPPRATTG